MIYEAFALNVLIMSDAVTSNIMGFSVEHRVVLVQALEENIKPQQLLSDLRLNHRVAVGTTINLSVSDTVVFEQSTHPRASVLTVDHHFFAWNDLFAEDQFPLVISTLTLIQSAVADVAKGTADTLTLEQSVAVEKTLNITVEQPLVMVSDIIGYLPDKYWSSYPITVVEP